MRRLSPCLAGLAFLIAIVAPAAEASAGQEASASSPRAEVLVGGDLGVSGLEPLFAIKAGAGYRWRAPLSVAVLLEGHHSSGNGILNGPERTWNATPVPRPPAGSATTTR